MSRANIMLTVLFEDPFWIGLCERRDGEQYEVCKLTFGAEPKEYEVAAFLEENWSHFRFSPAVSDENDLSAKKINPKRRQRQINRQMQNTGIGTKAQQALNLQREQFKLERKKISKEQKLEEKEYQFQIRQEKRRQKHKGH